MSEIDNLIDAAVKGNDKLFVNTVVGYFWVGMNNVCIGRDLIYAYSGSMESALDVHNHFLDGWVAVVDPDSNVCVTNGSVEHVGYRDHHGHDKRPVSRAWLLAVLRAYKEISQ